MKNKQSRQQWSSKRTFIVLDVPTPVAEQITAFRRELKSWRVALPVEITIAGSSGLGVLRYHETEIEGIFEKLGAIARRLAPIVTRLSSVEKFPATNVFYYALADPTPFNVLQRALVESGLRFERSRFAFTPHVTIADLEAVAAPPDFESLVFSKTQIVLQTLSVYNLDERILGGNPAGCRLLYRTAFGGQLV